jgi:putative hemolysin
MPKLIDLTTAPPNLPGRRLLKRYARSIERLLAIDRINEAYEGFHRKVVSEDIGDSVFAAALDELHIHMTIQRGHLENIPANGAVVIVANHPFGAVEGLILGALLLRIRPDVRLLGNYLLQEIIGIRDYILPVNPFGNKQDTGKNARGLRQCLTWLKKEGSLISFPSGEVASWHPRRGGVADPVWYPQIATLIRLSRATVVPIYFPGHNSALFMLLGLLHPRLRTTLLPRELVNKAQKNIALRIGSALSWQQLQRFPDDTALIQFLRLRTELLQLDTPPRDHARTSSAGEHDGRHHAPVGAPVPAHRMQTDIDHLPGDQCLLKSGPFSVWLAESRQIPSVLEEIGRLREITFREAQEGTGHSTDLDRFDEHYRHLFLSTPFYGSTVSKGSTPTACSGSDRNYSISCRRPSSSDARLFVRSTRKSTTACYSSGAVSVNSSPVFPGTRSSSVR